MNQADHLAVDRLIKLKNEIDAKLVELHEIQGDTEFSREVAFYAEFKALQKKYQFSTNDALTILDPGRVFGKNFSVDNFFDILAATSFQSSDADTDKSRSSLRRFRNPFTGEVIETKGHNNKQIREWKLVHGKNVVESWKI